MWKLVLHTDSQMSVCYASIGTYNAVFGWKPMNCKKLEMNFRTLVSHSCMTRQNAELTSTLKSRIHDVATWCSIDGSSYAYVGYYWNTKGALQNQFVLNVMSACAIL